LSSLQENTTEGDGKTPASIGLEGPSEDWEKNYLLEEQCILGHKKVDTREREETVVEGIRKEKGGGKRTSVGQSLWVRFKRKKTGKRAGPMRRMHTL